MTEEYRIDDLARAAGTTTRNIRGYQERGLLPRPQRRGRIALYTERHLRVARAITQLLERGFTAKHIASFFAGIRSGADLAEILDLTDLIDERWAPQERNTTVSRADLEGLLGQVSDSDVQAMLDLGVLASTADSTALEVTDSDLLDGFAELISKGVDLSSLIATYAGVREHLREAAGLLMKTASDQVAKHHGPGWIPTTVDETRWAAGFVGTMRKVGTRMAHEELDRSLDSALSSELREYQSASEKQP